MTTRTILVLGANGALGRCLTALLTSAGHRVTGLDLAPGPDAALAGAAYLCCDLGSPTDAARSALGSADWVLACLPEHVLLDALDTLVALMAPRALLIDTLSIKSPLAARIADLRDDLEYLGINPLFAPDVGFAGQNVVTIEQRGGPLGQAFVSHLQSWGARVVSMSAEQHDRAMAAVQVATHAAVLAFGMALGASSYELDTVWDVTTPPHRVLLALFARMMSASPEVYWEIQTTNPFAGELRDRLGESLSHLQGLVASDDYASFLRSFEQGRRLLGSHGHDMARYCARLFALAGPGPADT